MSKYTISFYDLDKELNGTDYLTSIDDRLDKLRPHIFDFAYTKLDDTTKKRLEIAILKHYYLREFAFESVGIMKLKLNDRLNLIMPRYERLYAYQDEDIKPFINSYMEENGTNEGTNTNTTNATSNVNNSNDVINTQSDTPQGILDDLKEGNYASYCTVENNTGTTTSNDNSNVNGTSNSNYTRMQQGLSGMTQAEAFRNYFDNLISIDEQIVYEMSDLFLVIW